MSETWTPDGGSAITFISRIQGSRGQLPVQEFAVTVREVAWSDDVVISAGGRGKRTIASLIKLASIADYLALQLSGGRYGALVFAGTTYRACLEKLDGGNAIYKAGGTVVGVEANAGWVIVSP